MEKIRIIGRSSKLSLLQMEKVKHKIEVAVPNVQVELITGSSRGDALQDIPLQTVEGSDFFTQEIFDKLSTGEADIAVHSLKDMSSEHFFGKNLFAVVDRDDSRDVAIFRKDLLSKIHRGETIVIGTCSPRREEMATGFLRKALPQLNEFKIESKFIRGNVDTRLKKSDSAEYDGIILATAGINRLLRSSGYAAAIKDLLQDKLLMVLPLIECVPAPCQGAIVAEVHYSNEKAKRILRAIEEAALTDDCKHEKKIAAQYGKGCLQKFGVTTIHYDNKKTIYAAGKNAAEEVFENWHGLPDISLEKKSASSTSDFMGKAFGYEYSNNEFRLEKPIVFVSNHKAVTNGLMDQLKQRKIWVAGSRTWYELAKKGLWIEGCADGLGLEALRKVFDMPLLNIKTTDVSVITNKQSEQNWRQKGWHVIATYSLIEKENEELKNLLSASDIIFWTSYRQYECYRSILKESVVHCCAAGETVELFRNAGIEPTVFPTIKSFQQWRRSSIPSRNAA